MIVKSKLNGQLRRPKNAAQRKALASRDFLRRQQLSEVGVAPEPVIKNVARLDGFSQYWALSQGITLHVGDVVTFKISYLTSILHVAEIMFGDNGVDRASRAYIDAVVADNPVVIIRDGKLETLIDGVDTNQFTMDGGTHTVEFSVVREFYVDSLCSHNNGEQYFLSGSIHEFKVERAGMIVNNIPLTNKAQGATQLATVGSVNATMPNYSSDVWERL